MKLKILLFSLLFATSLYPTIRYVSKTGSATPPYTSWMTASKSIQSCINYCSAWDTIIIGKGSYTEEITMKDYLTIIGVERDSCILNYYDFSPVMDACFHAGENTVIKNFTFLIDRSQDKKIGIYIDRKNNVLIEGNRFLGGIKAIGSFFKSGTSATIQNNYFEGCQSGVGLGGENNNNYPLVKDNIFYNTRFGVNVAFSTRPTMVGNIMYTNKYTTAGFGGGISDSAYVYNNLIITTPDNYNLMTYGIMFWNEAGQAINNTVIGNFRFAGIWSNPKCIIKNNIVLGLGDMSAEGIENPSKYYKYNICYGNVVNYKGFIPDSTNITKDPMLAGLNFNKDKPAYGIDAHLQMFSPGIDKGDPTIKDKDGSRSDIGFYGGPYGESYTYQNLSPRVPYDVKITCDASGKVNLSYKGGEESDFKQFVIYMDTKPIIEVDTNKIISILKTKEYRGTLQSGFTYYFRIASVDSQGNRSELSPEVSVKYVLGIEEENKVNNIGYHLYPNYPNPFNPSTTIGFNIPKEGRVRLSVYNITGEKVDDILNEYMPQGYHEVKYTPKSNNNDNTIASGIYILKLDVIDNNNIPLFQSQRKMIFMK